MGVVYRARDLLLPRDVALKLLRDEDLQDAQARVRLLREARLAATLSHPGICTVFEVGEEEGRVYIAMELVEGRPLSDLVQPQGMPAEDVARYGAQVADALAHAHARGIIHRDLKPANVVLGPDNRTKVLDFGLAKRTEATPFGESSILGITATSPGTVVGTLPYLAPEVLLGGEADAASDVWALGVLLHELASGERPFQGATQAEICASILHDTPRTLPRSTPEHLTSIIETCLSKDPSKRPQAAEAHASLLTGHVSNLRVTRRGRLHRLIAPVAVGALGVIAAVALFTWATRSKPAREEARSRDFQVTSNSSDRPIRTAALSLDGEFLATVDESGISVRSVDQGESRTIPLPAELPAGSIRRLSWFPDGARIMVEAPWDTASDVWILSTLTGKIERIRVPASSGAPSPDGTSIALISRDESGIVLTNPDGLNPRPIVGGSGPGTNYESVSWSPNGRRLAYLKVNTTNHDAGWAVETCNSTGGDRRTIIKGPPSGLLPDGLPLYIDAFLVNDFCWLGQDRFVYRQSQPVPAGTRSGRLGYSIMDQQVDPRAGSPIGHPRVLTPWAPVPIRGLSASRDGHRLSLLRTEAQGDIYIAPVERGRMGEAQRLTLDDRDDWDPVWSPDSRSVIFQSNRTGKTVLYQQAISGSPPSPLSSGGDIQLTAAAAVGTHIVYATFGGAGGGRRSTDHRIEQPSEIWQMPLDGGPPERVAALDSALGGIQAIRCPTQGGESCVVLGSRLLWDSCTVNVMDMARGTVRNVGRIPIPEGSAEPAWDVSPDGSCITYFHGRSLATLRLTDGSESETSLPHWERMESLQWSGSGDRLYAVGSYQSLRVLARIGLGGRTEVLSRLPDAEVDCSDVTVSSDGRYVAYKRMTDLTNVWILEGL